MNTLISAHFFFCLLYILLDSVHMQTSNEIYFVKYIYIYLLLHKEDKIILDAFRYI